jgi:hypothetical protein
MMLTPRRDFLFACAAPLLAACRAARGAGLEDRDKACAARLGMVLEAIQAFRRRNGALPSNLNQLYEQGFVAEPHLLVCPSAEQSGNYASLPQGMLSSTRTSGVASYEYEFADGVSINRDEQPGLPSTSRRIWKLRQLEGPLKDLMPFLLCDHKRCFLNISGLGNVYTSGNYWEVEFVDVLPEIYTMPFMTYRRPGPIALSANPRPASLPKDCLDLAPVGNALANDPWLDGMREGDSLGDLLNQLDAGQPLSDLPAFDSRFIIQVCGKFGPEDSWPDKAFGLQSYPAESRILEFQARPGCTIHLLHACAYADRPGARAGTILIADRDSKQKSEFSLIYGVNTSIWRAKTPWDQENPHSVWRGKGGSSGKHVRLFHQAITWDGAGQSTTANLQFQLVADRSSFAGPFIAAITLS